jgi:hypothetical protein
VVTSERSNSLSSPISAVITVLSRLANFLHQLEREVEMTSHEFTQDWLPSSNGWDDLSDSEPPDRYDQGFPAMSHTNAEVSRKESLLQPEIYLDRQQKAALSKTSLQLSEMLTMLRNPQISQEALRDAATNLITVLEKIQPYLGDYFILTTNLGGDDDSKVSGYARGAQITNLVDQAIAGLRGVIDPTQAVTVDADAVTKPRRRPAKPARRVSPLPAAFRHRAHG